MVCSGFIFGRCYLWGAAWYAPWWIYERHIAFLTGFRMASHSTPRRFARASILLLDRDADIFL